VVWVGLEPVNLPNSGLHVGTVSSQGQPWRVPDGPVNSRASWVLTDQRRGHLPADEPVRAGPALIPKLTVRVRFPSPAPIIPAQLTGMITTSGAEPLCGSWRSRRQLSGLVAAIMHR
jgi:hypothetical protein